MSVFRVLHVDDDAAIGDLLETISRSRSTGRSSL